jgi:integrase
MINGAVPYIWFRNYKERIMGKKRLERIIPLVDPLLGLLADYLSRADLNRNEPIFPTYGGAGTPPLIAQGS